MRREKSNLEHTCPFCRESFHESDEECYKHSMERIKANDPVAIVQLNKCDSSGTFGYFPNAAELGDVEAHYDLAILYEVGEGVVNEIQQYHTPSWSWRSCHWWTSCS